MVVDQRTLSLRLGPCLDNATNIMILSAIIACCVGLFGGLSFPEAREANLFGSENNKINQLTFRLSVDNNCLIKM